jgi:hypothetical protein
MLLKCRTESDELLKFRYLNMRMELTEKESLSIQILKRAMRGRRSLTY